MFRVRIRSMLQGKPPSENLSSGFESVAVVAVVIFAMTLRTRNNHGVTTASRRFCICNCSNYTE